MLLFLVRSQSYSISTNTFKTPQVLISNSNCTSTTTTQLSVENLEPPAVPSSSNALERSTLHTEQIKNYATKNYPGYELSTSLALSKNLVSHSDKNVELAGLLLKNN